MKVFELMILKSACRVLSFFCLIAFAGCALLSPENGGTGRHSFLSDRGGTIFVDSVRTDENIDWDQYKSISLDPVLVAGLSQMKWWQKIGREELMNEDLAELSWAVNYELKKILATIPNKKFQIVERMGAKTLRLEVTISEYQPPYAILKQMSPTSESLIDSTGTGRLSYEVKLTDLDGKIVFLLKDHENFESANAFDEADGEWYQPVLKSMYHFKTALDDTLKPKSQ